ncbi:MAG TPA: TetR/AcrR family transcriptional regulator [Thermoleophilaceae bacterium]|nr:TetR/AcrR family transcriptional regulator [Thermoleophilaceae bacterium]
MSTEGSPRKRLTRAEQQAKTRAALIDAARRVFLERGLAGASVQAIAAEAGFTRGAFYSNFSSKEELFVELIREQGYRKYAQLAMDSFDPAHRPTAREVGERLATIQGDPDVRWAFQLWFELIAQAGRDEDLRELAASFWSGNRSLAAAAIGQFYAEADKPPPAAPERLASALIALDIGLAIQHYVDPEAAPLDLYPELFELLFSRLVPAEAAEKS